MLRNPMACAATGAANRQRCPTHTREQTKLRPILLKSRGARWVAAKRLRRHICAGHRTEVCSNVRANVQTRVDPLFGVPRVSRRGVQRQTLNPKRAPTRYVRTYVNKIDLTQVPHVSICPNPFALPPTRIRQECKTKAPPQRHPGS